MTLRILRYAAAIVTLLIMAGCIPRISVIHDGVRATVIDAVSKQPVEGARVVDGGCSHDAIRYRGVLASSDARGQIRLNPATRIEFVALLSEGIWHQALWICTDGYVPVLAIQRGGWNEDFLPSKTIDMGTVELVRSDNPVEGNRATTDTP